jgi:radical SAM protein with 4Fe4S-binding SPASM domain
MNTLKHYLREIKATFKVLIYMIKKGDFKSIYPHIWSRLFVQNVGPGLIHPLYRKFPSLVPYPREIEVEVTTKCHLRCIICERTYWKEKPRDLSFEEFKYIIDQFPRLKWINVTGEGSAFLNKDYPKMLAYLKSKGIFVKLVESFSNLKKWQMEEMIRLGVNRVVVSMDGATKETYEKIKAGASFDEVIRELKLFHELKKKIKSPLPQVSFRFIVTKLNAGEIPAFIELIASLGISHNIQFAGLLDFKEIKDLSFHDTRELMEEAEKKAKELKIDLSWSHLCQLPPITKCTAWTQPYIMMGGYVLPCCQVLMSNQRPFLREHSLGNIFEKPFKEIWNSEEYRDFRKMVPRRKGKLPLLCRGCRGFNTLERK